MPGNKPGNDACAPKSQILARSPLVSVNRCGVRAPAGRARSVGQGPARRALALGRPAALFSAFGGFVWAWPKCVGGLDYNLSNMVGGTFFIWEGIG